MIKDAYKESTIGKSALRVEEKVYIPEVSTENTPGHKKIKATLLLALIAITGITCIRIPSCTEWTDLCLQHIGTLLLLSPLLYDTVKNRMPLSAFVGVALFAFLHVLGARWSYSNVPYTDWFTSLGVPADYFKAPRNHYDRMVHVSFGLLMFSFLLYVSRRWVERKPLVAIFIAWLLVQTGSMIYEIFEWQLGFLFARDTAERYNGQQGDMWDAQKDMALAMIGSTIMAIFYAIKAKYKRKN